MSAKKGSLGSYGTSDTCISYLHRFTTIFVVVPKMTQQAAKVEGFQILWNSLRILSNFDRSMHTRCGTKKKAQKRKKRQWHLEQ